MERNNFIMIGNFGLDYDFLSRQFLDASSGDSFAAFLKNVTAITDALGLEIVETFDDSIVVTGDDKDRDYLEKYFGDSYSFAHIDKDNLEMAIDCQKGVYNPPDTPGRVKLDFDMAKSKIIIPQEMFAIRNHCEAPKASPTNQKFRYDA